MADKISLLTLVIALAALGFGYGAYSHAQKQNAKKETAYERVMRTHTLRCGYSLWPGDTEIDPNTKQLKGIVPDYANAMAEKLGIKIEWAEEVMLGQQVEALASGKIDALCSSDGPWVYSEAALVDYVEPAIHYTPVYIYGRASETRFKNPQDMNSPDVRFSTIDGDISLAITLEKFPKAKNLAVPQSGDVSLLVANVMTDKADLVVSDPMTVSLVNANSGEKLVPIFQEPAAVVSASFSVKKGEQDLLQMLNQGARLLQGLGITGAILDRYDPDHTRTLRVAKPWVR